jgi:hypothetical protein
MLGFLCIGFYQNSLCFSLGWLAGFHLPPGDFAENMGRKTEYMKANEIYKFTNSQIYKPYPELVGSEKFPALMYNENGKSVLIYSQSC